jgi:F-type H+-transporting ATPase subunit gamma
MTERLSDVENRIVTTRQLSQVVSAIRSIAAARSRRARLRLDAVRAHADILAEAIGRALAFLPDPERPTTTTAVRAGHAVVAFCAEQGFAGTFSSNVLDAALACAPSTPDHRLDLFVVGDRGLLTAGERGLDVAWSAPMILHDDQATLLAERIADALYRRLNAGTLARVTIVHAMPDGREGPRVVARRLLPFDFGRFPARGDRVPPLTTLEPGVLLARLAEEYVFAELCEAVVRSFAAENEARVRAMTAAREKVADTLVELTGRARRLRQEAITSEIVELATGTLARPGD